MQIQVLTKENVYLCSSLPVNIPQRINTLFLNLIRLRKLSKKSVKCQLIRHIEFLVTKCFFQLSTMYQVLGKWVLV